MTNGEKRRRAKGAALVSTLTCAVAAVVLVAAQTTPAPSWKPVDGKLLSRFARDVSPARALPDYPRPQLVRAEWLNLNGLWQYAIRAKVADGPGPAFDGAILVPFAPESSLSGVGKTVGPDDRLWYRRTFRVPAAWTGSRVWLRFDAVDWETRVSVNGKAVGTHTGGYDPFAFDITDVLAPGGDQELVVSVWDPSDAGPQPRGKQVLKPRSIWYTPTSGIWQTVWLEPLPPQSIDRLALTPDADAGTLTIEPRLSGPADGLTLRAAAISGGRQVAAAEGAASSPLTLTVPDPRLWSPADPFLYDLKVSLTRNGRPVDEVSSYFGLRKISVGRGADGSARLLLNNKPLFQFGFLDQGFWPDGLHTPPSDDAIRSDIASTLSFGMNLARKHIKVEPDRWYYWADRLGLLVWQDMPSGGNNTADARVNSASEWRRLIDARYNHPSIVMWVPFNEGWGQPDAAGTREIADWTARYDPTRLVNNASGWTDAGAGHVSDVHKYPGPSMPALARQRAAVLGEFGGLGLPTHGHTWQDEKNWGYVSFKDPSELERAYRDRIAELRLLVARGLSAAIYTQTTDVEIETNGLMTYDREIVKIPPDVLATLHKTLYEGLPAITPVLPTSEMDGRAWRYTTAQPADDWMRRTFDDRGWQTGQAPFGGGGPEGVPIRTPWTTLQIWMRQSFDLPGGAHDGLYFVLAHDEDVTLYLNGVEAASVQGSSPGYVFVPVNEQGARALTSGSNLVAVQCRQTKGAQAIDVGIVSVRPGAEAGPR
jgi:hypothetical protein